jgi:hypothetical protein
MIPDFLSHLKTYKGYPVPFTQLWIDGQPDFRTVDPARTMQCVHEKPCAICGRRLGEKSCFIGGPLSKTNRLFTDPPMHKQCAEFASHSCPFVSGKTLEYSDRPLSPAIVKVQEIVSTERPETMFLLTAWTKKTELVQCNQERIIQSLMRHSSLSVTIKHYVKALPAVNVEAIKKLNPKA